MASMNLQDRIYSANTMSAEEQTTYRVIYGWSAFEDFQDLQDAEDLFRHIAAIPTRDPLQRKVFLRNLRDAPGRMMEARERPEA